MKQKEIINIVEKYVKDACEADATGHDWWHIQRVRKNAVLINKQENANEFIVTMTALLHDLYDHKFYQGNCEEKLLETLKKLQVYDDMTKNEIENIIHSCANLGFSSNFAIQKKLSLKGKIVQDADRLDAIGAIGIARVFTYGGKKERPIYNPDNDEFTSEEEYRQNGSKTSIGHFYDKLLKLKNLMNTDTAKIIAQERHQFLDEWEGKK